jgi:6,7-dimethyl-8-ribityllumazine synthase
MTLPTSKPDDGTTSSADGLVVGVVSARWNADIVEQLTDGACRAIVAAGATPLKVTAPGAFELPFAASVLARSGRVDAIVVVGCVIRGETTHYELVSEGCAQGVMRVQLDTGVPIGLGIATVENRPQAVARSGGPGEHNVGEDAARAALEMAVMAADLLVSHTDDGASSEPIVTNRSGAGRPVRL